MGQKFMGKNELTQPAAAFLKDDATMLEGFM